MELIEALYEVVQHAARLPYPSPVGVAPGDQFRSALSLIQVSCLSRLILGLIRSPLTNWKRI